MVLVSPRLSRPVEPAAGDARPSADGPGRPSPAPSNDILALLRQGSGHRPRVDAALAGGLRAWLEDAAGELAAARGEDVTPLFLGPRLLLADPVPPTPKRRRDALLSDLPSALPTDLPSDLLMDLPMERVVSTLVRALFRQLVTTGSVDEPLGDATDALGVDPAATDVIAFIDALAPERRAELAATLRVHTDHLRDLTPRFAPGWLPRTGDRVAIPLAGGRVVLTGAFDLLVGAPVPGRATLCALGLVTGGRWSWGRTTLHYLALLETLRSGAPPFRLALLHSAAGRYGVEDVRVEHLRAIVAHLATRLSALARADA